jgi:hypothetical protein
VFERTKHLSGMEPVSLDLNETVRDLTVTTLGMRLTASYRWCRVSPSASRGIPVACTKDCGLLSRPEDFWEPFGGCPRGGIPPCV